MVRMTDERHLTLFPARTIVRDPHHHDFQHVASRIWTWAEPEFRLCWMKLCSSDNHYTMAPVEARIKTKKNTPRIRIQSISMSILTCWIQPTKKNKSRKKWWEKWISVAHVSEQCCIRKNNGKLRNRIQLYVTQNIWQWFGRDTWKKKVTLTLNKPAYIGICIFKLSKVLKWEFHYDYIKINMVTTQDYYSQTVIAKCMKLKLEMSIKILAAIMK